LKGPPRQGRMCKVHEGGSHRGLVSLGKRLLEKVDKKKVLGEPQVGGKKGSVGNEGRKEMGW